jgi:hypothetical protein
MWKWIMSRSRTREKPVAHALVIEPAAGAVSRKYLSLYKYLEHRYADATVLTFPQIEDLLGFALPPLARTNQGWWSMGAANAGAPSHAAAWLLAGRTATPNLQAETVVFERTPSAARHLG